MAADLDFGPHTYIRVPIDSSGKRMEIDKLIAIEYGSGTIAFVIGEEVIGATSGAAGIIVHLRQGSTTSAGTIYVVLESISIVQSYTDGENLQVDAVTNATVTSTQDTYTPGTIIKSAANPLLGMRIDKTGSAYVRFEEGPQLLTAFGQAKASSESQMAAYTNFYDMEPSEWLDETNGVGAAIVHLPNEASVALDVGTVSGGYARRTTHRYHIYQPGFGTLMMMTVGIGDTGKADCVRKWGMMDASNGMYFELSGSNLSIDTLSSTSGSVVETQVLQDDWNGDKVDGTGGPSNLSGFNLDVSKINIYWIDMAWLGAGRVRFGVFAPDGSRITCHTSNNGNSLTVPYMASPTLPLRCEIINSALTGSASRMKMICAQVSIDGNLVPELSRRSIKWDSTPRRVTVVTTIKPVVSFRAKTTINSIRNSKTTVGEQMGLEVTTNPCRVSIWANATLTGSVWANLDGRADVAVEEDVSATSFTGGTRVISWMLGVGHHTIDFPDNFGLLGLALRLRADDTQTDTFTIAIEQTISAGATDAEVSVTGIDI